MPKSILKTLFNQHISTSWLSCHHQIKRRPPIWCSHPNLVRWIILVVTFLLACLELWSAITPRRNVLIYTFVGRQKLFNFQEHKKDATRGAQTANQFRNFGCFANTEILSVFFLFERFHKLKIPLLPIFAD